jgi:phosphatidylinositol alpha-mannosyltransferase
VIVGLVCPYDLGVPGGVQHQVRGLESALSERGIDVRVVGPGPGGAGRARRVPVNRSVAPVTLSPTARSRTRRALADVDVVHVHEPLVPVVSLAALASRPLVATFHADPPDGIRRLYRLLRRPIDRLLRGAVVTAVSPVAASALPWRTVEVIPNGVEAPSPSEPVDRRPGQVVFVGRDEPRKGLDVLLEAWPSVRASVPDAELVVVGADRPAALPGVTFAGRVSEAEKWRHLRSSTVAVAPNLGGESFGIVVVEAMAAGCAVVASAIPAFSGVAGGAARLVPPSDAAALGEEIVGVLTAPANAAHLADAGVRRAADFRWETVADRYLEAYKRAAATS